jgi:hypothetical protein
VLMEASFARNCFNVSIHCLADTSSSSSLYIANSICTVAICSLIFKVAATLLWLRSNLLLDIQSCSDVVVAACKALDGFSVGS